MDKGKLESLLISATEGFAQSDTKETRQIICGKLTGVGAAKTWRNFLKTTIVKKRPLAQLNKFLESKDAKALGLAYADRNTYDTRPGKALEFANFEYKGKAEIADLKFIIKMLDRRITKDEYEGGFPMSKKIMRMRESESDEQVKPIRKKRQAASSVNLAAPAMIGGVEDDEGDYTDPDDDGYNDDDFVDEGGDSTQASGDPDDNDDDVTVEILDLVAVKGLLSRDPDKLLHYIHRLHLMIGKLEEDGEDDEGASPEDDDYMEVVETDDNYEAEVEAEVEVEAEAEEGFADGDGPEETEEFGASSDGDSYGEESGDEDGSNGDGEYGDENGDGEQEVKANGDDESEYGDEVEESSSGDGGGGGGDGDDDDGYEEGEDSYESDESTEDSDDSDDYGDGDEAPSTEDEETSSTEDEETSGDNDEYEDYKEGE